jgi:hypothetical protein
MQRFGCDFRCSGNRARREANQTMDSGDWAVRRLHECIVGSPCRCCPDRNLGLHAIRLMPHLRQQQQRQRICGRRAPKQTSTTAI